MYQLSPSITIDAAPEEVWEYLLDVEEWWVASNPEHESIDVLSDDETLTEGTRIRVEEEIAGISGVATGEITELIPNRRLTWEASEARYRFYSLPLTVSEGITWELTPTRQGTELTAHVWASFPDTLVGRLFEWGFVNLLNGLEKDYYHAMQELEYVRRALESRRE